MQNSMGIFCQHCPALHLGEGPLRERKKRFIWNCSSRYKLTSVCFPSILKTVPYKQHLRKSLLDLMQNARCPECCNNFLQSLKFQNQRDRHRKTQRSSVCRFSLQMPRQLQLGKGEANIPELSQNLPGGWQGHSYYSHHLLPPRLCVIRNLKWGVGPGFKTEHPLCSLQN